MLVTNIDNSTKFYRDTLGLVVKNATNEWTEFFTSGTVLALHPAKTRVKPNSSMLVGFMVSDFESIATSLKFNIYCRNKIGTNRGFRSNGPDWSRIRTSIL